MKIRMILAIVVFAVFLSLGMLVQAAEVISVQGSVQVQSPSEDGWRALEKGMAVAVGDLIRTARNSVAEVALDADKKNMIRIEPKTLVTLNSATADIVDRLDLAKGKVYANLEDVKSGLSFEINTPSAVAGVRGSALSVYVERDSDEIVALQHTVFVKAYNIDKQLISEVMLPEGFKTMVERFGEPSTFYQISSREFERFDNNMADLSANLEGRMSARAKAQEARQARERSQAQVVEQVNEEQDISQEVVGMKEAVEDQKTQETIEQLRDPYEEHCSGPYCP